MIVPESQPAFIQYQQNLKTVEDHSSLPNSEARNLRQGEVSMPKEETSLVQESSRNVQLSSSFHNIPISICASYSSISHQMVPAKCAVFVSTDDLSVIFL